MGSEEIKALDDKALDNATGGISAEYVGGAGRGSNRCKAYGGRWNQYCNRPNWVDLGRSYTAMNGETRKSMVCLNCGASANFKWDRGQWILPSDGKTVD